VLCLPMRQAVQGNGGSDTTRGGLVSTRSVERLEYDSPYENANVAWKAQWGNTLAWSTMLAVAAHAAAFVFWPTWEKPDSFLDPDIELLGTVWTALYAPPVSDGGGQAAPLLVVLVEPDSLPIEDVNALDIVGGSELAQASLSAGLREHLTGHGSPGPTLVQFSPARGPRGISADVRDNREEGEGDGPAIEDSKLSDLALILETSSLDLSRLSGVRPQIVLPGTSAWILIRNPTEVDRFMSRRASARGASTIEGLVDVAVWIDEWGSVEWAEISRSSGRQEMDEIALALFNEIASFRPARDQGVRVSMSLIFSVPFPW
jgi:TonB family protein